MRVAVVTLPDTALLVRGVAGRADPLGALRSAAVASVRAALGALVAPDDGSSSGAPAVVVVAPGPVDRVLAGPLRAGLGAAGVPDGALVDGVPTVEVADGVPPAGVPVARPPGGAPGTGVAASLHVLAAAHAGTGVAPAVVAVLEVAGGRPGPTPADPGDGAHRGRTLRGWGATLVGHAGAGARVLLLVVGSGSARHGPDGPLADDGRAPAVDDAIAAALGDPVAFAAWAGGDGPARPPGLDHVTAAALAVSGWAPWQVLAGALAAADLAGAPPLLATPPAVDLSLGVLHAVACWVPAADRPTSTTATTTAVRA